jgi:hypothetical protein
MVPGVEARLLSGKRGSGIRAGEETVKRSAALIAVLAVVLATGCSSAPAKFTVHGTVRVPDNPAAGEGSPVQVGDQVTITDPSGKVIGFTHLDGDADQGPTFMLTFGFIVQIPQGEISYGVHVDGLTGTEQYTEKQMRQGPALCSGDACS